MTIQPLTNFNLLLLGVVHAQVKRAAGVAVAPPDFEQNLLAFADRRGTRNCVQRVAEDASAARVGDVEFVGVAVDVGNPHLACLTDVDLAGIDLSVPPSYEKADFPEGVNIEIIRRTGTDRIRMRVHERGVGETRSCGTGTVAAAAAYLRADNRSTGTVEVSVPGGGVTVTITDDGSTLTGPAVLVAAGTIDGAFWERHR